jgi:hypothetical protein
MCFLFDHIILHAKYLKLLTGSTRSVLLFIILFVINEYIPQNQSLFFLQLFLFYFVNIRCDFNDGSNNLSILILLFLNE